MDSGTWDIFHNPSFRIPNNQLKVYEILNIRGTTLVRV